MNHEPSNQQSNNTWGQPNNGGWNQQNVAWGQPNNSGWNQQNAAWGQPNNGGWNQQNAAWGQPNNGGWNQQNAAWGQPNNGGWNQQNAAWGQTSNGPAYGAPAGYAGVSTASDEVRAARFRKVLSGSFLWMFIGLLLTAASSFLFIQTGALYNFVVSTGRFAFYILLIIQVAAVIGCSVSLSKMKAKTAAILFLLYSVLTGITCSLIFVLYQTSSIVFGFVATALVFGAMAAFGALTKKDLSPVGYAGGMLLIGAIIVSLINLVLYFFLPGIASGIDMVLNYVILALFIGLTAYDVWRIKKMSQDPESVFFGINGADQDATVIRTLSIYGGLQLYLDFINIFLRILAIFGRRK